MPSEIRVILVQSFATLALAVALVVLANRGLRDWTEEQVKAVFRHLVFLLLATVVASIVTSTFVRLWSFRGDSQRFGLVAMVDGTAARPFVYRRLSAEVIDAGASLLGAITTSEQRQYLRETSALRQMRQVEVPQVSSALESWTERKALLYHAAYAVVFAANFSALWLARGLMSHLMPSDLLLTSAAPLLGLLLVPLTFLHGGYFYDAPELMFLTAFAWCLARPTPGLLVPVFLLAVLNKEANLLLVPIAAAALWGRLRSQEWVRTLAALTIVGAVGLVTLYTTYAGNAGSPVEVSLLGNLQFWTHPRNLVMPTYVYGPMIPVPRASNIFILALFAGLIRLGWADTPPWLRRAVVTSMLVLVPLMLTSAYRDEMRNMSVSFPFVFAAAVFGIRRAYS